MTFIVFKKFTEFMIFYYHNSTSMLINYPLNDQWIEAKNLSLMVNFEMFFIRNLLKFPK